MAQNGRYKELYDLQFTWLLLLRLLFLGSCAVCENQKKSSCDKAFFVTTFTFPPVSGIIH
jgi:hypothetical protein